MGKRLNRKFFQKDTKEVAQKLLGNFIVRKIGSRKILAKIVETEAYHGFDDLASHASKGKTPRNQVMFEKAGLCYVYQVYGLHFMFNIVCGTKNFPAAVLIRGVEIEGIDNKKTNGPAKLCNFLKIDKNLNREDLIISKKLWIEDSVYSPLPKDIISTKRIGVEYAGDSANLLWRFYIKYNPCISKK